jgi:hypothetical protein
MGVFRDSLRVGRRRRRFWRVRCEAADILEETPLLFGWPWEKRSGYEVTTYHVSVVRVKVSRRN